MTYLENALIKALGDHARYLAENARAGDHCANARLHELYKLADEIGVRHAVLDPLDPNEVGNMLKSD